MSWINRRAYLVYMLYTQDYWFIPLFRPFIHLDVTLYPKHILHHTNARDHQCVIDLSKFYVKEVGAGILISANPYIMKSFSIFVYENSFLNICCYPGQIQVYIFLARSIEHVELFVFNESTKRKKYTLWWCRASVILRLDAAWRKGRKDPGIVLQLARRNREAQLRGSGCTGVMQNSSGDQFPRHFGICSDE